ncbi:hypothetical protein CJU90_4851 [Yarrowia sp. C11]|nr:hypothetical protein CJU90_4851 [Yarrowia sp. C11]KAG5364668.1 hypothetical protein CKK34_3483 [Yarrowia sp. E02]
MTRQITQQLLKLEDQKHKCRQAMMIMEQQLHDYQLELNALHVRSSALRAGLASTREKHHYLALKTTSVSHDIDVDVGPPYEQEQLSIEYADQTVCGSLSPSRGAYEPYADNPSPARSVESLDTVGTPPPVTPPSPPVRSKHKPGTHVLVCGKSASKLWLYGIDKGNTKIGPLPIKSGTGASYRLGFPPGMFLDEDDFPAGDLQVTTQELAAIPGCPPLDGRVLDEIDRVEAAFLVHGGVYLLFHKCSWGTTYTKEVLDFLPSEMQISDLRN